MLVAQRGRSHLLLRNQEEGEKTVKGIKKIADEHKRKYEAMLNENEYLKSEIERIEDELEKEKVIWMKMIEIEIYQASYIRKESLTKMGTLFNSLFKIWKKYKFLRSFLI